MSDPVKPKRPHSKSGRPRSRPPIRDPRVERSSSSAPGVSAPLHGTSQPHHEVLPRQPPSLQRLEVVPGRIAALEAELARLGAERDAEADELARMLVRIAEAERTRATAEQRAGALAERVRELEAECEQGRHDLDAARQQLRRSAELVEMASRRAGLAERSASDGAVALERAAVELEADRARLTDLEARLARTRREHSIELVALRAAHDEACVEAARAIEEERAAAAQGQEQLAAAEADLAAMRDAIASTASLVDEIDRREEMTAALRGRALDQARRILSSCVAVEPGSSDSRVTIAPGADVAGGECGPPEPGGAPERLGPHREASLQAIALDEVDLDLMDE